MRKLSLLHLCHSSALSFGWSEQQPSEQRDGLGNHPEDDDKENLKDNGKYCKHNLDHDNEDEDVEEEKESWHDDFFLRVNDYVCKLLLL